MIVYLNGAYLPREEARISPEDRGFLFADAIYEVARFYRGRAFHLEEHLQRMREGLAALRIDADPSFYPPVAVRLLQANGLSDAEGAVYAQVGGGGGPGRHGVPRRGTARTVFAFARASDPPPSPAGGRAILLPDER